MPPTASPRPLGGQPPREKAITFEALLLVVVVTRLAAHFSLSQPLQGDALANVSIAHALAAGQWPAMQMAQSIGYPAVLAPFFALFGDAGSISFGVNLSLAIGSALLVWQVARGMGLRETGQKLALLGYALWLPGIWDCTLVVKENLGVPLMLASAWLALRLLREGPRVDLALASGAVWGAGMLTAPSLLPLIAAPVAALVLGPGGWRAPLALAAVAAGAALTLAPWGWLSGVLPAMPATGALAMLAAGSGPMGSPLPPIDLHPFDATLGRLVMFWWPHFPDAGPHALSRAMTYMRIGEVTQYITIFTLGFAGLVAAHTMGRQRAVIGVLILGFWLLGGSRLVGDAYRDPVMPLLIVLAAAVLSDLIYRRPARRPAMRPLRR